MGAVDSEVRENRKAFAESRFGSEVVTLLRTAFGRSRHAMLILDNDRRMVTGNHAAADLLSTPLDEIPWRRIDDFAPLASRATIEQDWKAFLKDGSAEGWIRLIVPGHTQVMVEYSGIANVLPRRHLLTYITPDEGFPAKAEDLAHLAAETTDLNRLGEQTQLTTREREVLTHVAAGLQTREIADLLFLSPETVKSHVQNVLEKLGAHTRAHAVALALMCSQITFRS